jgi:hypothetical protein
MTAAPSHLTATADGPMLFRPPTRVPPVSGLVARPGGDSAAPLDGDSADTHDHQIASCPLDMPGPRCWTTAGRKAGPRGTSGLREPGRPDRLARRGHRTAGCRGHGRRKIGGPDVQQRQWPALRCGVGDVSCRVLVAKNFRDLVAQRTVRHARAVPMDLEGIAMSIPD